MEPTNRSKVGNSTGGQNFPPANSTSQSGYDPIFSPTGMAGAGTGVYNDKTPAPIQQPQPTSQPQAPTGRPNVAVHHAEAPQSPQPAPQPQPIISSANTPAPDPNHTSSTATGDIILQTSPASNQTKSKLPLIIGVAAAVLAVGAGLFILIANPFAGNNSTNASTVASFNKFMNYLYDGSDATGYNEDAYADSASYKFEEMLNSDDQDAKIGYFNVAQRLLDDVNNIDDDEAATLVTSIYNNLEFLATYATTKELSDQDIFYYYIQNDGVQTKKYIRDNYQQLTSSGNSSAIEYGEARVAWLTVVTDELMAFQDKGCLYTDGFLESCINNITWSETFANQIQTAVLNNSVAETSLENTQDAIIIDCISLAEKIGVINNETE